MTGHKFLIFNTTVPIQVCTYWIRYMSAWKWRQISGYEYDFALRGMKYCPSMWEGTQIAVSSGPPVIIE